MHKDKAFSIIIPVYKRNDLAKQAIRSVLKQSLINLEELEIIVSDDEDSPSIIKKNEKFFPGIYKDIIYVVNKHKEGPGGNRQTGLDIATGKYIVFLDSDDQLKPNFISQMKPVFNDNKEYVGTVCFSKSNFDKDFKILEKLKLFPLMFIRDAILIMAYLFNDKCIYPSSFYLCQISHMVFKRDAIKNQKFNYTYRHGGEDWDFFIQALEKGEIRIVSKRLLRFRYSLGSSTSDPINKQRKWESYSNLVKNLKNRYKRQPFYYLFGLYIRVFSGV